MAWQFQYCTDGSTWVEIDNTKVPTRSVRHISQRHQDLKPSTDTFELQVKNPTSALLNSVLSSNSFMFKAALDGSGVFSGWLSTETSADASRKVERLTLKAYDESWFFDRKIDTTLSYANYYVCNSSDTEHSIVHQLLALYGLPAGRIAPTNELSQIDYFVAEPEQTYDELLTRLLFEYGWLYYIDETGVFRTSAMFPDDDTASATFDDANIIQPLTIAKKRIAYDGSEISYYAHDVLASALISSDTSNQDDINKCNIEVAADGWYPEGCDTASVYTTFSVPNKEIVCTTNGAIYYIAESGIVESTPVWYPKKVDAKFHNVAAGPQNILKFDITGTAVVKGDKGICRVYNNSEQGADLFSYECTYVTTYADAAYLASGVAQYYNYSSVSYQFRSATKVAVGTIVLLDDDISGITQACRIYSRSATWREDGTANYEYALEGIAEYALATVVAEGTHSTPAVLERPADSILTGAMTATETLSGFVNSSGGTTTPTVPTIQVCKGVYQGIVLLWDRQLNLTNFDHYELQVSDNGTNWYALVMDGSDWKGTGSSWTPVNVELFVHTGLTTATALRYKVRRVTKTSTASDYSATATATPTLTPDSTASINALYANVINAGILNAIFANITGALTIGYAGSGTSSSPEEGDRRVYVDQDEIGMEVYTHGAWSTERQVRMGGSDTNGNFIPFLACRGVLGSMEDAPISDPLPNYGYYRFDFDNDKQDQYGIDPWALAWGTVAYSTSPKWEGTHSITTESGGFVLEWADAWLSGDSCTMAFMFRADGIGFDTPLYIIELNSYVAADGIQVMFLADGVLRVRVDKGGTVTTSDTSTALEINTWYFIGLTYDASTNTVYMRVNDYEKSFQPTGTWGAAALKHVYLRQMDTSVQQYMDDLIINFTSAIDPDIFFQHVTRDVAWTTEITRNDLILRPRSGGRVIHWPAVSGEPSHGTPHPTSDANRTATLVVNTSTNTAGVWSAAVTMTGVPVGAKAAWCQCHVARGGATPFLAVEAATGYTLSDITVGTNFYKYFGIRCVPGVNTMYGFVKIHLDSNRQFKWCTSDTSSDVSIGSAIDYEM